MKSKSIWPAWGMLAALAWLPLATTARADEGDAAAQAKVEAFLDSLQLQSGTVAVPAAQATLNLTPGYAFLPAKDAQRVLTELWSNPPDDDVLGMIVPGRDPHVLLDDDSWAVVVTYTGEGYVSDEDASKIDYDDMLKDMQKADRDDNAARLKQGYPAVDLVGWAEPPRYDAASHKLYWARDLKFHKADGSDSGRTLNYDIRVLGRQGYLSLNAVAPIEQLAQVRADMPQVLAMTEFDAGQRYADYNPRTDKLAAYGIGALVAGGIAAKAGLFAKLGVMLLALKKFVVIGLVAIGGLFAKLFKRRQA
ncbi:hypothetical protein ASG87_17355 [Frateuria sp. Soil773]|uniref:DUF2167 domain-containing protein n=1 Tax=Frateuria sp. Soil773 TaxID=1736407 RepID=UPI0006FB1372|nr:DUF2167 domain-containing protein [Frateuria sp. Soil773]KRE94882.1 hypothetical protein ASG87_17355 [Frateuria sp. Soil773]